MHSKTLWPLRALVTLFATVALVTGGACHKAPSTPLHVDALFEHPTQALVNQLTKDHVPSQDEINLIAVYWAGMIVANTTGSMPIEMISSGIIDKVQALASEYPSFFKATSNGGFQLYADNFRRSLQDQTLTATTVTCGGSCYSVTQAQSDAKVIYKCLSGSIGIAKAVQSLLTLSKGGTAAAQVAI